MATQRFQDSCELPADVERAFDALTDRDFMLEKSSGTDPDNTQVSVTDVENGRDLRVDRLVVFDKPLPPVARPFVGDSIKIGIDQIWRRDGDGYRADVTYSIEDQPVSLSGTLRLTPTGNNRSRLDVEMEATVKLPLIGGKGAKLLAEAAQKRIRKDFEKNQAYLNTA